MLAAFSDPRFEKHVLGEERGREGGIAKQKGKMTNPEMLCDNV